MNEDPSLVAVEEAQQRGDVLLAYDRAMSTLDAGRADPGILFHAVLALARSGATDSAAELYQKWRLDEISDKDVASLGARLAEDVASLPGRLAKDMARKATGAERVRLRREAAERYEAVFRRTGGSFPGVNAGTMWLLSGDAERSEALGAELLAKITDRGPDQGPYYTAATGAELALLLGDVPSARREVERAAALSPSSADANTTWRQLKLICAEKELPADLLAPLAPPTILNYCGYRFRGGEQNAPQVEAAEAELRASIERLLNRRGVGIAFGSLASGADLIVAETLLERGAELNVVLPFAAEEFSEISVRPGGDSWLDRFRACMTGASSVTIASDEGYLGDDVVFDFGTRIAMGLAILRSRQMEAPIEQLAVLREGRGESSHTARSVDQWTRLGLECHALVVPSSLRAGFAAESSEPPASAAPRRLHAVLFADLKGFSRIPEERLPVYWSTVMRGFADVLDPYGDELVYRNTWGDSLYLVFTSVSTAASCALELQSYATRMDLAGRGLPSDLAMRLAAHCGPVFEGPDPVVGGRTYFGSHVLRTARMEPVTPPGQVFVTEPFAAVLAAEALDAFGFDYAGRIPAAKGYGVFRMYRLRRATEPDTP